MIIRISSRTNFYLNRASRPGYFFIKPNNNNIIHYSIGFSC